MSTSLPKKKMRLSGESKVQQCQSCRGDRIFEVKMGFKVGRSEWDCYFKGEKIKHTNDGRYEDLCESGRFFSMEDDSPFKAKDRDAKIAICLDCGQTQGKFPATNPLECIRVARGLTIDRKSCECSICEFMNENDYDDKNDDNKNENKDEDNSGRDDKKDENKGCHDKKDDNDGCGDEKDEKDNKSISG